MKNSNNNSATMKSQVQSGAVTVVKAITYPAHLVLQTAADLVSLGQGQAIKLIDGTPVIESAMACQSWTQHQQMKVVEKAMEVKAKYERQREANRQQDIDRLNKQLNKLEGVEEVATPTVNTEAVKATTEPTSVIAPPAPPKVNQPIVEEFLNKEAEKGNYTPPVVESSYPINKSKGKKAATPVMTAAV